MNRNMMLEKKIHKTVSVLFLLSCLAFPTFASDHGYVYEPAAVKQSAKIYDYDSDAQFLVNTRLGYVTDIELKAGETIQKIAAGDTVQWSVEKDSVGGNSHVYIKPLAASVTNMIINTNVRSYRLIVTTYNDDVYFIIKWNYPADEKAFYQKQLVDKMLKQKQLAGNMIESFSRAKEINRNYIVTKNVKVLSKYIPTSVFDDGRKTYIEIAPGNFQNMPIVFYFDEWDKKKLQLVNYRLKGNFMEIDRVMDQIKLVYSQKSYLILKKKKGKDVIPSPKKIVLNKSSDQNLAYRSITSADRQSKTIDFHKEAPLSLIEKIKKRNEENALKQIRAVHAPDSDTLDRLLEILESDDEQNNALSDDSFVAVEGGADS